MWYLLFPLLSLSCSAMPNTQKRAAFGSSMLSVLVNGLWKNRFLGGGGRNGLFRGKGGDTSFPGRDENLF